MLFVHVLALCFLLQMVFDLLHVCVRLMKPIVIRTAAAKP